jgi:branched-chain amino acid transport system substrate-binding protein
VPLANPDFAPFLHRAADANPEAVFVFTPAAQGDIVMKQYAERGLDTGGVRLIGTGDFTDDEALAGMSDAAIGVITAHNYSAAHPSEMNMRFVSEFKAANNNLRPNFVGVHTYDGMHLVYAALGATGGDTDGDKLLEAMKGLAWESPRGPISIDAETRDIIQNIYVRRVERVGDELYNVEFATYENVKDPVKAGE